MRPAAAARIAAYLLKFFSRRVLDAGVLRLRGVRWSVFVLAAALLVSMIGFAYHYLRPFSADEAVWKLLLSISTLSVVQWVAVAFLFVKVLFLTSDDILELTSQLPVTAKERAAALLVFEWVITVGVSILASVPVIVSAVALTGATGVELVTVSILAPVVVTYSLLSFLHTLLLRIFVLVHLRGVAHVLAILTVFALVVVYSSRMTSWIGEAADPGDPGRPWPMAIAWLADGAGVGRASIAALVVSSVLVVLVVALMPRQHVAPRRYVHVRLPPVVARRVTAYDWCFWRSQHFFISSVIALVTFFLLLALTEVNPSWALAVFSLGGLYLYSATAPLRRSSSVRWSAGRIYWWTIRPQLLTVSVLAVPAVGVQAVVHRLDGAVTPLMSAFLCASITACVGVVFPAERNNPFSAFLGLLSALVVVTLVALGVGLLKLPIWTACCFLTASSISYAIQAIHADERRRRREERTDRPELPRGGSDVDHHPGGRDVARSDVLHGQGDRA